MELPCLVLAASEEGAKVDPSQILDVIPEVHEIDGPTIDGLHGLSTLLRRVCTMTEEEKHDHTTLLPVLTPLLQASSSLLHCQVVPTTFGLGCLLGKTRRIRASLIVHHARQRLALIMVVAVEGKQDANDVFFVALILSPLHGSYGRNLLSFVQQFWKRKAGKSCATWIREHTCAEHLNAIKPKPRLFASGGLRTEDPDLSRACFFDSQILLGAALTTHKSKSKKSFESMRPGLHPLLRSSSCCVGLLFFALLLQEPVLCLV